MSKKIMIGKLIDNQSIEPRAECFYLSHDDDNKMLYIDVESEDPEGFEQFLQQWKGDTFSNYASRIYNNNMVDATLSFCLPGFETDRNQILSSVVFDGYQRDDNVFNITAMYLPPKN